MIIRIFHPEDNNYGYGTTISIATEDLIQNERSDIDVRVKVKFVFVVRQPFVKIGETMTVTKGARETKFKEIKTKKDKWRINDG